jgi:hypothetical protein
LQNTFRAVCGHPFRHFNNNQLFASFLHSLTPSLTAFYKKVFEIPDRIAVIVIAEKEAKQDLILKIFYSVVFAGVEAVFCSIELSIFFLAGISWVPHHQGYSIPAAPPMVHAPLGPPPAPFMHIPYTESPIMIPMGGGAELPYQQQNVTQIGQHNPPIMTTQQPPVHFYNNHAVRSSYNRYGENSSAGGMRKSAPNSNHSWREREVTKIPPRFQKQR